MKNLETLELFNCNLEKPTPSKVPSGISLDKRDSKDSNQTVKLASLSQLKYLNLSYNQGFLKSANDQLFGALFHPSLKELYLIKCGLYQSVVLKKIIEKTSNLERLDISENESIAEIMKCLPLFDKLLPKMKFLKMRSIENKEEKGEQIKFEDHMIFTMKKLVHLNISNSNFPIEALLQSYMPKLEALLFDLSKLRDDNLKSILECKTLKNLKVLSLRNNNIHNIKAPELKTCEYKNTMQLQVLDLTHNKISSSYHLSNVAQRFLQTTLVFCPSLRLKSKSKEEQEESLTSKNVAVLQEPSRNVNPQNDEFACLLNTMGGISPFIVTDPN